MLRLTVICVGVHELVFPLITLFSALCLVLYSYLNTPLMFNGHIPLLRIYSILNFFSYRLKQELETLVNDKCQKFHSQLSALQFRFHQPPAHPSTVAWVGGMFYIS